MTYRANATANATSLKEVISARERGEARIDEATGKAILRTYGVHIPQGKVIPVGESASVYVDGLAPPYALKVIADDIVHKSDAGGVRVGLESSAAVDQAIAQMASAPGIAGAQVTGYLVEEMAPRGHEVVVGAVVDPQFGPMIMVGLGGIFIEVLKDVAFALCPITQDEAHGMLDGLRGVAILDGARGGQVASRQAIVDVLIALGGERGLFTEHWVDIAELDVNPLIVNETGAVAVDARFILTPAMPPDHAPNPDDLGSGRTVSSQADDRPRQSLPALERFGPLFAPKTVAVVGASTTSTTIANTFIRRMKAYGYPGQIYPIHPKAEQVEDLTAYPSLSETPEPVDYAYIAIGAARIPQVIATAGGNVKFAQVISSGFREVASGKELEQALVTNAHAAGVRIVGPQLPWALLAARRRDFPG